jgi:hypothetical protein
MLAYKFCEHLVVDAGNASVTLALYLGDHRCCLFWKIPKDIQVKFLVALIKRHKKPFS